MTNPLKIYSGSNALLYTTPVNIGCRRRVQLMNEDSITVKFSDKTKMKFPVGTRIGDFYITKEQQEKYNAATGGYDYELKFDAYYWLWANKLLFYVMPGVTNAPKETSFKLTATIDVHAAVILRAMNALGFTYDGSPFRVDTDEGFSTEAKYISYANMSILGGIQAIADAYECEWWVVGNSIHFGKCNAIGEYDFTVGENVASITSDAKTTPANRLVVFGSTRNLPPNYRTPESSDVVDAVVVKRLMLPEGTPYLQTSSDIPEDEIVEEEVVLDSVYPRTSLSVTDVETYDSTTEGVTQTFYRVKYGTAFHFSKDYILPDEELHVVFESGDLNSMDFAVRFNPLGAGEKFDDGSWNPEAQMFEIVVNEDYGRQLPDGVLHPKKTDKFSLYGWDATKMEALGLVSAAEQELLTEGNKLLDEYRKDKQTYTCPMMWDWCKEQAEEGNSPRLGSVVNLHFTAGDAGRKSRIIGFEHDLDIKYSNVTYICGEKVSTSRLKTLESKVEGITKDGSKVKVQNSLDFLSKRYSDRTPYQLASDLGFEVGNFLAGVSGGMFGIDKADGQSFAEVAKLFVRGKAFFETLTTIEAQTLAGKQYIAPGGAIKCSKVEEVKDTDGIVTAYRCYFLSEQDGEKTDTKIIAGDQAISEMFNAKTGTANKVSNHRYWRYVNAVNNDAYTDDAGNHYGYIDLSASDCEAGSSVPKAGDIIDQLGNRTDATRQTAIVFSTVDADSPSIKMFGGIGSGETNAEHYTLNGKAIISFGRDATTGKVYFRLGSSDATQYLDYKQDSGLELAGKLSVNSTIGDKTFEKWLTDHGYTDDTLAQEAKDEIDKYSYLKAALKQNTEITNGLVLSTLIQLGYTDADNVRHTLAGMNGSYLPELGGRTIAAWYGGPMVDLFNADGTKKTDLTAGQYAASLDRMDGSGYKANGNFRWDSTGVTKFGDTDNGYGVTIDPSGRLTLGSGIEINIGSGAQGLGSTLSSVINWQNNFMNLLVPVSRDASGNDVEISWAEANQPDKNVVAIKAKVGFYSEDFISAHGLNDASTPITPGATALADLSDVTLSAVQNGHALVFENGQWVNKAIGGGLDEAALGTYLSTNNYAKKSDIPSNYVTLDTVQTITGVKFFDGAVAHSTAVFFQKAGHEGGYYLSPQESGALDISTHVNRTWVATVCSFQSDGIFRSFYGMMAPNFKVPGGASTQFLKADGSLDGNGYVNKAGDTMTGNLNIDSAELINTHPDTTGGTARTIRFNDHDGTFCYGFGSLLDNHVRRYAFIGWGAEPWSQPTNLAVGDGVFTYKGNNVLHTGNYASQLDSRYARRAVEESITGYWTFYARPQVYAYAGAWAYERFTCGVNYWDIATTDTASGLMAPNALEFRKLGGNGAGMFLRWDGSSYGKLCIVSETTESSIGYFDRSDLSKPKWTVGTQIGGDYCFGWWASGPNYSPGWRMALSEAGLLTIRTIHGPRIEIGAKNSSYIHYDSLDGVAHWFNMNVRVQGQIYAGPGYDQLVWHAGNDGSGSGLDADLLDGLHSSDFFHVSNTFWNNNETVEEWAKRIGWGAPTIFTETGWSWAASLNLNVGGVNIDRMRYSAFDIRTGNLNSTWQQKAILFLPTFIEEKWIYIAQMTTTSTAGSVTLNVRRYADYDTVLASNVASATRLQGTYSLWGQSFYGNDVNNTIHVKFSGAGNYNEGIRLYGTAKDNAWANIHFGCDPSVTVGTHYNQWILGRDNNNNFQLDVNGSSGGIMAWLRNGYVGIGTYSPVYKLTVNGDIYATSGWLRTYGQNGLYFESYGGGWHMTDTSWIRAYNSKGVLINKGIPIGPGQWRVGLKLEATDHNAIEISAASYTFGIGMHTDSGVYWWKGSQQPYSPDYKTYCMMYKNDTFNFYGAIHSTVGIWSDNYISAHGQNTSSDERLKYILDPVTLDIRKIADAPSVRFRWLKENEEDAGSIAQYWQEVLPWTVRRQPNGYLGLDYGRAALLSAISIAKTVTHHEDRLMALETRCNQLEAENRQLRTELQTLKQYN